jgi:iron-sulfur cluster repair protein YtfE (RIC family)
MAATHFGASMTVRDIAACSAGARRVLDVAGVDYSCDASQSLADICGAAHLPVEDMLEELEREGRVERDGRAGGSDKRSMHSLVLLAGRVHDRTREMMDEIGETLAHLDAYEPVAATFWALRGEVLERMDREEHELFGQLDCLARVSGGSPLVPCSIGDVTVRLRIAREQHASIAASLTRLRLATRAGGGRGEPVSELHEQLHHLDRHLVHQMYLENHVLFRRAIERIAAREGV